MEGKVALITGGASGIGLKYAIELLRSGVKGVTLADINSDSGKKALADIEKEFGLNKAIFVQTDVINTNQFENAFKRTIEQFQNVDILINNAGMLNDALWEKTVDVNVKGTINGMLLGLEKYIPKYKSADEGVIVNISSVAGVQGFGAIPVYSSTKFAVLGMTLAWAVHYKRTHVKVIALCPGVTNTPLVMEASGKNLGEEYEIALQKSLKELPTQTADVCAKAMVKIIKNAPNGTAWIAEGGEEPYEFIMPERETFKK